MHLYKIQKYTRPATFEDVSTIKAKNVPDAIRIAWKRWPELAPSKSHKAGRAIARPIKKIQPPQISEEDRESMRRINQALSGNLSK